MARKPKASEPVNEAEATEVTDLAVVEQTTAVAAFNDRVAFDAMIADIKKAVKASMDARGELNMSVKADRDFLRSLAAKIPKVKTRIDAWGAEIVEAKRKEVAAIDAMRTEFKNDLDELKDETRKPLTDFEEAEKKRKADIQERIETARELGRISFGESSADIQARIDQLPTGDLTSYDEFQEEAKIVIEDAYNQLVAAKNVQVESERAAAKQIADRAELERLQKIQADNDRIAECNAIIATIKMIGLGELEGVDNPTTSELVRALNAIRITPAFGDLFDKASDTKDTAMERLNDRATKEAEERAKVKAKEDAEAATAKELQDAKDRADEAEKKAADAAAELERKKTADAETAAQVARDAEALSREQEQHAVANRVRELSVDENREIWMKEAADDVAAVLEGKNRASAPGAIVAGVIKGIIRHVRFGE